MSGCFGEPVGEHDKTNGGLSAAAWRVENPVRDFFLQDSSELDSLVASDVHNVEPLDARSEWVGLMQDRITQRIEWLNSRMEEGGFNKEDHGRRLALKRLRGELQTLEEVDRQ